MPSKPILSLCMVVKDEEENLTHCLESVGDAVDEVVVVDTGSRDRTKGVAAELGCHVHSFSWIGDFSAARNFSVDKAQGKYILWLDADDRMRPSEREKLKALKPWLSESEGKEAFYFRVINQDEAGSKGEFIQVRLFPNILGARFEGRIHEQIYHVLQGLGIRLSKLDIVIDHMGYDDAGTKSEKARRNLGFLMEELENDPESPYLHFHIANTYSAMGEHAKSIEHYERIRTLPDLEKRYPGSLSRVLLEMASSYHKMGHMQSVGEVLLEHNASFPQSWLGRFFLAEFYVQQGRWQEAIGLMDSLHNQELHADIFPVPLDDIRLKIPLYSGQCHEALGDAQLAVKDFERALKYRPHDPEILARLGRLSLIFGDIEGAIQYCADAAANNGSSADVLCNLGVAYKRAGRLDEALKQYLGALELDPSHLDTRANLGHLLFQMGRLEEAYAQFVETLKNPGEWLDIRLALAQIYWLGSEVDGFIARLDEILYILGLPRDRELHNLHDLMGLLEEIRTTLNQRGREQEGILALQCIRRITDDIARAKAMASASQ
jgi:tetratricopeptide (TPR) repeat protein